MYTDLPICISLVRNTTSDVINALVEAKSGLQDAAENFDSRTTIVSAKENVGNAVVNGFTWAGSLIERAGIYTAIDQLVHGIANLPTKVWHMHDTN